MGVFGVQWRWGVGLAVLVTAACGEPMGGLRTEEGAAPASPMSGAFVASANGAAAAGESLRVVQVRIVSSAGNRDGVPVQPADRALRAEVVGQGRGGGQAMFARLIEMGSGEQVAQARHIWGEGDAHASFEFPVPGQGWAPGAHLLQLNLDGVAVEEVDVWVE